MWRLWAKALGSKETPCNNEADRIALIRTIIFASYLITNAFIVAGVARHWNDEQPKGCVETIKKGAFAPH